MERLSSKHFRNFLDRHCGKFGLPENLRIVLANEEDAKRFVQLMLEDCVENTRGQIFTDSHVYDYLIEDWSSECLYGFAEETNREKYLDCEEDEYGWSIWDDKKAIYCLVDEAHASVFKTDFEKQYRNFAVIFDEVAYPEGTRYGTSLILIRRPLSAAHEHNLLAEGSL